MTKLTRSTLYTLLLHGTLALSATLVFFKNGHADTKPPELRTLASYPHGSFLENLEVQADGRVYLKKKIDVLATDETVSTFSELDLYPISLISIDNGYLVAGHGKSFFAGEDFVKSQKFVVLNKSGEKTSEILAPQAMMLNGMVQLANGMILVADSLTATICSHYLAGRCCIAANHTLVARPDTRNYSGSTRLSTWCKRSEIEWRGIDDFQHLSGNIVGGQGRCRRKTARQSGAIRQGWAH